MATHKLRLAWKVTFEEERSGESYTKIIHFPKKGVYYFHQQKDTYLVRWLENMIEKNDIVDRVVSIQEFYEVIDCEEYHTVIGM